MCVCFLPIAEIALQAVKQKPSNKVCIKPSLFVDQALKHLQSSRYPNNLAQDLVCDTTRCFVEAYQLQHQTHNLTLVLPESFESFYEATVPVLYADFDGFLPEHVCMRVLVEFCKQWPSSSREIAQIVKVNDPTHGAPVLCAFCVCKLDHFKVLIVGDVYLAKFEFRIR